jgi:hypothetical protein
VPPRKPIPHKAQKQKSLLLKEGKKNGNACIKKKEGDEP